MFSNEQPSAAPILHPPGNHDGHLHKKHLKHPPSEDDYCRLLQEWWDRQQQGTTGNQFPPHINIHNNTSKNQIKEVVRPSSSWPNNGQQQDYYSSSPNHQHYAGHHQHHQSGKEDEASVSNQLLEPLQHDHQRQHQHPSSFHPSRTTRSIATPTMVQACNLMPTIGIFRNTKSSGAHFTIVRPAPAALMNTDFYYLLPTLDEQSHEDCRPRLLQHRRCTIILHIP